MMADQKLTPLGDPDNVRFTVVENYVYPSDDGFTDDEVQRILNGQPLVASAVAETFHLPGKHDQEDHAHKQGKKPDSGGKEAKAGKSLKVTHMLVHRKHEPGTVIAITSDGKKRVRWDGKKYELQRQSDAGDWDTEQTAIKSKAYVAVNAYASDWTEPAEGDGSGETSTPARDVEAPQPTSQPEPAPEPEPEPAAASSSSSSSSSEEDMLNAYNAGYTVKKEFDSGESGSKVELLELSDGSTAVRKTTPLTAVYMAGHGNTTKQEYLAGRVFSAINQATGNDDMVTARVDGNTILTTFASGLTGASAGEQLTTPDMTKQKKNTAVNAELKRHAKLQGGKEIAMLDFLTRNTDRHGLNWITEGNSVKPVDQGFAFIKVANEAYKVNGETVRFESIPRSVFIDHWFKPRMKSDFSGYDLTPKYSKDEVSRIQSAVAALKPAFEREDALDWYDGLMARFKSIEESVNK